MKRTPVYHKQSTEYRVVYRPNQLWVAQRLTPAMPTREHDPWEDLHSPCIDREQAIGIMYSRLPLKK